MDDDTVDFWLSTELVLLITAEIETVEFSSITRAMGTVFLYPPASCIF